MNLSTRRACYKGPVTLTSRVALVLFALLGLGFEWEGRLGRLERELASGDVRQRREVVRLLASYAASDVRAPLLRALGDPEPAVRREAAAVAGRVQLREAVPVLREWLEDPDPELRASAGEALGMIGDPAALVSLVRALGDADVSVRLVALRALVALRDPAAVVPVLGRLDDDDPDVRAAAARGLAELGEPRAVVPLIGRARDETPAVRQAVLLALGTLQDARALPALVIALRDESEEPRLAAVASLGQLRDPRGVAPLAGLLADQDARVARAALAALGAIGDEPAHEAILGALDNPALRELATELLVAASAPALTRALASELRTLAGRGHATAVARVVLRRLEREPAPDASDALLEALLRDVADRGVLLRALAATGDPEVLVPLLTELSSGPEALDALELYFARHPADGRAADPLLTSLARAPAGTRPRVVRLLGQLGALRALDTIRPLLEARDPALRLAAVEALGALGDPVGARALEPLLAEDEGSLRFAAAEALGRSVDADGVARLVERLGSRERLDRHATLHALGGALARGVTGDPRRTLGALDELLAHPDERLADRALDTLARWDGEPSRARRRALASSPSARHHVAALTSLASAADDAEAREILRRVVVDPQGALDARAAAAAALGAIGEARDLDVLLEAVTAPFPVSAAAAFGVAQRLLAGAPANETARERLCGALRHREAHVRANLVVGLAALGHRCEGRPAAGLLERAHAPVVRAAAARWLGALEPEHEALRRCAEVELTPEVSRACASPALPPREVEASVHAHGPTGQLLRRALVVLRFADGTALVTRTDASGHLRWPLAPRGPLSLGDPLKVPLQP
ncbi:MAG: HEAT repeat domain-containing protein [Myxococcales bacterium]|nr:HEAT repeat domain-containing protein [Myxococcales bacterium]